ncbi:MAG: glycosyltransferase family 1 protein [Chloroflexi bacterium]|nr:glycosyltransferase family 1 protein [Chloroflexota bacterium]
MLIGIDTSRALRAKRTGTERYSLEIIQHLLLLPAAAQHQWRLYVDVAPPEQLFPTHTPGAAQPNVEICHLPARRLWTHMALAREVVQRKPDLLFIPAHVLPLVLPSGRLPPSVVTVHDLGYHYFPEAHARLQRRYLQISTRWNAHAATQLIAVSQATANDLRRFYGTAPAKIQVVHEAGMSDLPDDLVVTDIRRRDNLPRPYALFVGTLQPRKNLVRLIQAYAQLSQIGAIGWDLVLAGSADRLQQALSSLINELGLAGRIHLLGYVADADLPTLYAGATFFCFPSLFEGFGLPVLEAQRYGVPVMTANNSSLPEIAGDAAILVDPLDIDAIADAMLRLSQDEMLRQKLITAGYANVKRFSWEKAARETLAVLEAAAKKSFR